MTSYQILRSSSILNRVIPLLPRFGSTTSKAASSSPNKSTNKKQTGKSSSEYLAADMYDYTTFSHYDMEIAMTKYRLPQPSAFDVLKPDPPPPPPKK